MILQKYNVIGGTILGNRVKVVQGREIEFRQLAIWTAELTKNV